MESYDEQIEFLDEDADILKQYEIVPTKSQHNLQKRYTKCTQKPSLHKGKPVKRKKPNVYDRDDDYDPQQPEKKLVKRHSSQLSIAKKVLIPDLVDPICLPVIVSKIGMVNVVKVRNWNKECVKAYKSLDDPILPARSNVKITSTKTITLRNIRDKNGSIDTSIVSKVIVKNSEGQKKEWEFSGILPMFMDNYKSLQFRLYLHPKKTGNVVLSQNTVLLTQDKDILTVYNPSERLTKNYELTEKMRIHDGQKIKRLFLEETSSQNVCAACYQCQALSDGYTNSFQNNIRCEVCKKTFASTYIMLSHLKSHSRSEVLDKRQDIAKAIALVTQYVHNCRICQSSFTKINKLKEHLASHSGTTLFRCDIGRHVTK